ncbi:MAG TPA: hypothetical protein VLE19_17480 [Pyrinomonadaceae bacterium]|nr:hypothetical protein [Pyrinomonadaceae bacterium]
MKEDRPLVTLNVRAVVVCALLRTDAADLPKPGKELSYETMN